ncbi:hypothetical protein K435DRAFT_781400 [Dendrothele bispora CBS 962.96]|uniref:H+/nucleoside cotransporter n=1 Tax=Dendrothele bispora (strain CBS 962.96) TaxID=1314807 RepID=A0A4S8LL41_DENBC|nr:hypothetical protein K435DRAFT_781400 [Dendrothele bispora CBS 962.96]
MIPSQTEKPSLLSKYPQVGSQQSFWDDRAVIISETAVEEPDPEKTAPRPRSITSYLCGRPQILFLFAALTLGWWISLLVLRPPGYGWVAQTVIAWFIILLIAFQYIPTGRAIVFIGRSWRTCVERPFYRLPRKVRLAIGWLALLGIIAGSVFGFEVDSAEIYGQRAKSILGVFVFQAGFWATSQNRSQIPWPTVIVGLFLQQLIALFVFKTKAGFDIFHFIITAVIDFFSSTAAGQVFLFDQDTVDKHWFIVNVAASVLLFLGVVEVLYYLGVMQWVLKKLAWFFYKIMNISGAEAIVATASPVVGQGESACLVKPYMSTMTKSEIHQVLTSGYSTVSGSFIPVYTSLGVPAQNLITSSVMSIPAAIAISKMRCPETDEPVTRGAVVLDRGPEDPAKAPVNIFHAFLKGATFGLFIVGQIVANTLVYLSLLSLINGLLTWIGRGFGIHELTLQLVLGYVFYPLPFLLGVPNADILPVAKLLATKLVANELLAYQNLQALMESSTPLSARAYTITSYALCGFANLSSLSVQGVLLALAPNRSGIIVKVTVSALLCGYFATLQTAAIAGMLV